MHASLVHVPRFCASRRLPPVWDELAFCRGVALVIYLALLFACVATPPGDEPRCTYSLSPPNVLTLSGRPVLSPVGAVAASDNDVLIAGSPTFSNEYQNGNWVSVGDSLIGVVHRGDGSVVPVAYPEGVKPSRTSGVRAVPASGGGAGWDVIFAQNVASGDSVSEVEYWAGRLNRNLAWTRLRSHTLAGMRNVEPRLASNLASSGTEMTFAVPVEQRGLPDALLLISIRGSSWTVERLPPMAYASVAYADQGEAIGIFVDIDRDAAADENSLYLYTRNEGWLTPHERLYPGLGAPAHLPHVLFHKTLIASWVAGDFPAPMEAHIMVDVGVVQRRRHFLLSKSAFSISSVGWGARVYALIQQRANVGQPDQLALYSVPSNSNPSVVASGSDPFMLPPLSAVTSTNQLVMAGLSRGPPADASVRPRVHVSVMRANRSCRE